MQGKPTADECLDVLNMLWHHVAMRMQIHTQLAQLDTEVPQWRTMPVPPKNQNDEDLAAVQRFKAWSRARDLLTRGNRC